MFETLAPSPADPILALMLAFREDQRDSKVDLGVGVYKDAEGQTPVMKAVKMAEERVYQEQQTKTYVSPTGDVDFCHAMESMILGESIPHSRVRSIQTPGGSGALKVLSDLLMAVNPDATTWVSDPTWPNHLPMLARAGHHIERYPYYDAAKGAVDFDATQAMLSSAKVGDIVLLHGCCHNPTGADLDAAQWQAVAALCLEKSLIPFVDLAYQGFGDSLEQDAAGVQILARELPELVIASSCSKNMALYRERTGCALIVGDNETAAVNTASLAVKMIRSNYSMPPDHGAAIGRMVMLDKELHGIWREELESMRLRMAGLREEFAAALRKRSNSERFDYIAEQRGMFSRLPLTEEQVTRLRVEDGIYMVGDGRFNVAGLPQNRADGIDQVAAKIVAAMD